MNEPMQIAETFCSFAPTQKEWMFRRDLFTGLGSKYYNAPGDHQPPEKFDAIERELERCYCAGAYLACMLLADAAIEILRLSLVAEGRMALDRHLGYIKEDLQWLRNRRNDLTHYLRSPDAIDLKGYTSDRSSLESDARQASAIVYHVARAYSRIGSHFAVHPNGPLVPDSSAEPEC